MVTIKKNFETKIQLTSIFDGLPNSKLIEKIGRRPTCRPSQGSEKNEISQKMKFILRVGVLTPCASGSPIPFQG